MASTKKLLQIKKVWLGSWDEECFNKNRAKTDGMFTSDISAVLADFQKASNSTPIEVMNLLKKSISLNK